MSQSKPAMSSSYKAVFAFAILMIFVVIMSGAITKSTGVGFGAWVWGYTAWLMYKRGNAALISLQKFILWLWIASAAGGIYLSFSSDDVVERLVGFSGIGIVILSAIGMAITYGLLVYFRSQLNPKSGKDKDRASDDGDIDDQNWAQALAELSTQDRNEAVWAKVFSEADGDQDKAKARYIRVRVAQLNQNAKAISPTSVTVSQVRTEEVVDKEATINWASDNAASISVAILLLICIGVPIYMSLDFEKLGWFKKPELTQSIEPKYRTLKGGTTIRWLNDSGCLLSYYPGRLFRHIVNPIEGYASLEVTQDDRLVAVIYYSGLDERSAKSAFQETLFLEIKSTCKSYSN